MRKDSWKFVGIECLYVLLVTIAFMLCDYVQMLEVIDTGRSSGGLFGGIIYVYNPVFYIAGVVLAIIITILCNKFILSRSMELLSDTRLWAKIVYFIFIGIFCVVCFFGLVIVYFLKFGLAPGISDTLLTFITFFGWPAIVAIYMIVVFIINARKIQPELKIEVSEPIANIEEDIESLDDIMQGTDYIKTSNAENEETQDESDVKAEAEIESEAEPKDETEAKDEAEIKAEEEVKEEGKVEE